MISLLLCLAQDFIALHIHLSVYPINNGLLISCACITINMCATLILYVALLISNKPAHRQAFALSFESLKTHLCFTGASKHDGSSDKYSLRC